MPKQPLPYWMTQGKIVYRPNWWLRIAVTTGAALLLVAACQGK